MITVLQIQKENIIIINYSYKLQKKKMVQKGSILVGINSCRVLKIYIPRYKMCMMLKHFKLH